MTPGASGTLDINYQNVADNEGSLELDVRYGNENSYIKVSDLSLSSSLLQKGAAGVSQKQGILSVPFTLSSTACDGLGKGIHYVTSYESIVLNNGLYSYEVERNIALDCGSDEAPVTPTTPTTPVTTTDNWNFKFCAYNYPKQACDYLVTDANNAYGTWQYTAGSGVAACGSASGYTYSEQDYGYTDNTLGELGACIYYSNSQYSAKKSPALEKAIQAAF
ncbi:MAG: hypothetical protein HQL49_05590 [Gammaproteobacteria bacterium]|nr:hypothetical protein [Gammaproteobacteria bacterium]